MANNNLPPTNLEQDLRQLAEEVEEMTGGQTPESVVIVSAARSLVTNVARRAYQQGREDAAAAIEADMADRLARSKVNSMYQSGMKRATKLARGESA